MHACVGHMRLRQDHVWARGSTSSAKMLLGNMFPTIGFSNEACSYRYGTPEYQSISISPACVKPACFADSSGMFWSVNDNNMLHEAHQHSTNVFHC